ncbi:MAG: hypothetical protein QM723_06385 [Myxococcaceae bacterium]
MAWILLAALANDTALVRSFGNQVFLSDLGPPQAIAALKHAPPEAIQDAIVVLLVDRLKNDAYAEYLREKQLEVSAVELERCTAGLKKKGTAGKPGDNAREMMIAWKANVALFHEFGGRLVPTLLGLEAIDAERALISRYEAKKLIVWANPNVREAVKSRLGGAVIDVSSDERSVKEFEAGPRCLH